jgi:NRAMP (natural resistance-associated macrophage protein)-like metal ion transporter
MKPIFIPSIMRAFHFRRWLGPGLITGAADDDPSGIATYSQAGAQYGFGLLWTMVLTYPLMAAIQMVSAKISLVTGRGLAANMQRTYPIYITLPLVLLLLVANIINIAADLAAMSDAIKLVFGGSRQIYSILIGLICLSLQIFIPYNRYVYFLKWLTLSLFAYVGTVFASHVEWSKVLQETFLPHISLEPGYMLLVVGVLGTTISPYLFFWQASEEVEEIHTHKGRRALLEYPKQAPSQLRRMKWDTVVGMGFSNTIAFFIMLTTAATLFSAGIHDIQTSAEAAAALRPIAGEFAFGLFALGIIGTGLLAIPVLAGSAAYAIAELIHKPASLSFKPITAKHFYIIIATSTLIGIGLDLSGIDAIKALLWSAVINGITAVPLMFALMHMASKKNVMGEFTVQGNTKCLGWISTILMTVSAIVLVIVNISL